MQKVFSTPTATSLYIEIGSGSVTVHTDDTGETEVDVDGKDAESVLVEQRGNEIVVIAPKQRAGFFGSGSRLDVHVSMPHDSALSTRLGSADVRVIGRLGDAMLRSGSGDVQVDEITGDGSIATGSGDIRVDEARHSLRTKSGSGDVSVDRVGQSVSISTGSGNVEIGSAGGAIEARSGSGDMRVRDASEDVSFSTGSGDLTLDLVHRGSVRAKNASGDITVGIPDGVPVWTDVNTVTGSVHSSLQGAGEPEEGQDFVELRAKTVSGDIFLEQK
jgi:DUF4097 and DUF4098 domain-containing protein YvlB